MQTQYEKYAPQGFIQLTVLTQDDAGGPASQGTAAAWAEDFSITHPVLADPGAITEMSLVPTFPGYPTFALFKRGSVATRHCAGGGCVLPSHIEDALPPSP